MMLGYYVAAILGIIGLAFGFSNDATSEDYEPWKDRMALRCFAVAVLIATITYLSAGITAQ
jgi:hypothetical protein